MAHGISRWTEQHNTNQTKTECINNCKRVQIRNQQNHTHTHTHTHVPPSGQSSLNLICNAIIHMRHTTYRLQNTHAIETKPHTHRDATVRSIFNAIIPPHDLHQFFPSSTSHPSWSDVHTLQSAAHLYHDQSLDSQYRQSSTFCSLEQLSWMTNCNPPLIRSSPRLGS